MIKVKPVNVVLISLDAVRADHLSCYGYARKTTPQIDALAQNGVQFEQVIAASFFTLPSHASMLSGLHPSRHGASHKKFKFSSKAKLLAQILQEQNYITAGFVSNDFVSEFYGFDRGFNYFENFAGQLGADQAVKDERNAEKMVSSALEWLNQNGQEKFFLFMHLIDAHAPYNPPQEFKQYAGQHEEFDTDVNRWDRFESEVQNISAEKLACMVGLYDGEINFMDAQLKRLFEKLKALGVWEITLLIITSDHGEQFKDHGGFGHDTFWEEVLRVPLIFHQPKLFQSKKVKPLVRHIDLVPTVLDYLGLNVPENVDGVSLRPMIEKDLDLGLTAINEVRLLSKLSPSYDFCVRTSKWKYFERKTLLLPRWRPRNFSGLKFFAHDCLALGHRLKKFGLALKHKALFDLENDPLEKENLLKKMPEMAAGLKAEARQHFEGLSQEEKAGERVEQGTARADEVEKRLEALGYID